MGFGNPENYNEFVLEERPGRWRHTAIYKTDINQLYHNFYKYKYDL